MAGWLAHWLDRWQEMGVWKDQWIDIRTNTKSITVFGWIYPCFSASIVSLFFLLGERGGKMAQREFVSRYWRHKWVEMVRVPARRVFFQTNKNSTRCARTALKRAPSAVWYSNDKQITFTDVWIDKLNQKILNSVRVMTSLPDVTHYISRMWYILRWSCALELVFSQFLRLIDPDGKGRYIISHRRPGPFWQSIDPGVIGSFVGYNFLDGQCINDLKAHLCSNKKAKFNFQLTVWSSIAEKGKRLVSFFRDSQMRGTW